MTKPKPELALVHSSSKADDAARAMALRREDDERIVAEFCRRPVDLLMRAIARDPQLVFKVIEHFPVQWRKVLRERLRALDKRKGPGRPGPAPETVAIVRLLDEQLRIDGWRKNVARYAEIARMLQGSSIYGTVKLGTIREILRCGSTPALGVDPQPLTRNR